MSAAADNGIIETARKRRTYKYLHVPLRRLQDRRRLKESFNVFLHYLRPPMVAKAADGLIRTAM
jgi:hypothetical protein